MNSSHEHQTHIDIGSQKLGYRVTGSGPDILLIHGWPLNRETWRNVVPNLGDYRCHLIDLPGSGTSDTPSDVEVSFTGHINAVIAAIEALELDSVVLVGHDSGGLVARNIAVQLPETVTGLILAGTEIPGHHSEFIDRLRLQMKLPGAPAIAKALMKNRKAARSQQLLGGLFWDRDLIEGDFRSKVLDPTLDDPAIFKRQLDVLFSYTHDVVDALESVHRQITVPSMLVWGELDGFFPVELAREMLDQFSGPTQFEVLTGARLLVHEEHPDRFAELISDFMIERAPTDALS